MKQQVSFDTFYDAFRAYGRLDKEDGRGGNFTHAGLRVLFDYLENLEVDTGEEMELDVVALCCEFFEESPEDIAKSYSLEGEWEEASAAAEDKVGAAEKFSEALSEHTSVCGVTLDGKIVYAQF